MAIISVVVGHVSGHLWAVDGLRAHPWFGGLVSGGAVTVFFVISGFLATRSLLHEADRGRLDPMRFFLRRGILVGAQVLALCVVILAVARLDSTDTTTARMNALSFSHAMTFTLNWWVEEHLLEVRPGLGHLWFTSVQQQWYLVLPILVLIFGPRRRIFGALMCLGAVACVLYRIMILETSPWTSVAVNTFARADGILWGVALGALLSTLAVFRQHAHAIGWLACSAILVLLIIFPRFWPLAFLRWWGATFTVVAAVLVGCVALLSRETALARVLEFRPLRALGTRSLVIYVWHFPIIMLLARHIPEWSSASKTLVFLGILAGVTWFASVWIYTPLRTWLRTHFRAAAPAPSVAGRVQ